MTTRARTETLLGRILQEEGRRQTWLVEQLIARGIRADRSQVHGWVWGLHVPVETTRQAIADALCRQVDEVFPPGPASETLAA